MAFKLFHPNTSYIRDKHNIRMFNIFDCCVFFTLYILHPDSMMISVKSCSNVKISEYQALDWEPQWLRMTFGQRTSIRLSAILYSLPEHKDFSALDQLPVFHSLSSQNSYKKAKI